MLTALCVNLMKRLRWVKTLKHDIEVVVDRIVIRPDSLGRIVEGVEQATKLARAR